MSLPTPAVPVPLPLHFSSCFRRPSLLRASRSLVSSNITPCDKPQDLSHNPVVGTTEGLELVVGLVADSNVKELRIVASDLPESTGQTLRAALASAPDSQLRHLVLDANPMLGDESAVELASLLEVSNQLRSLSLVGTGMHVEGLDAFNRAMKTNSSIVSLGLSLTRRPRAHTSHNLLRRHESADLSARRISVSRTVESPGQSRLPSHDIALGSRAHSQEQPALALRIQSYDGSVVHSQPPLPPARGSSHDISVVGAPPNTTRLSQQRRISSFGHELTRAHAAQLSREIRKSVQANRLLTLAQL